MHESISGEDESQPVLPDWNRPFNELFPLMAQPVTLSFLEDVSVPENFFEKESSGFMIRDNQSEAFLYHLTISTSPRDSTIEELRNKAKELKTLLRTLKFKITGWKGESAGPNLLKNASLFDLYSQLDLLSQLSPLFVQEADSFTQLLVDITEKSASILANQQLGEADNKASTWVGQLIDRNLATTPNEVLKILADGPIIANFAKAWENKEFSPETLLSDAAVSEYLHQNFSPILNNQSIRIARISGSDAFIYINPQGIAEELSEAELVEKRQSVGTDQIVEGLRFSYVTNDPSWIGIKLYNMCLSQPDILEKILENVDYLEDNETMKNKVILYSLGMIAHEAIHRLQTPELMSEYQSVATNTWNSTDTVWSGYPSEYVYLHATQYGSSEEEILDEDMADSVQIYLINADYLQRHFTGRLNFIKKAFPFLVANSAKSFVS